ncbi:MAG: glycosyltransferase [Propionibacteriaceae bacterium]|jgi:alpha-1,6-mannosyltransferase|nr:glycosyltransferase [Propionibacteriaceae bacterium]
MRIAQLANFVGPTSGGLRRAVDKLGRAYAAAGHQRLLIIPGPSDSVLTTKTGTIVTIASPALSSGYRLVVNTRKVAQVLERFQPTSVEVSDKWTMTAGARWAVRRGIPAILISHERLDDQASMFLELEVSSQIHLINRYLAKIYDRVVVTTRYSAGEWINTKANLMVCPLGVDLGEFSSQGTVSGRTATLQLVYAGRLSREKCPHLAVATAVELDRRGVDVQLNVFGAGPIVEELRSLAGAAPIFFHGYLNSRAALADAYRSADIALSVCPAETFGLAVLEALACGTPVVTADRGGARELVDASCAEWASPDPVFLAEAVMRLAARVREDPARLSQAARARAEQYPWGKTTASMLALHEELSNPSLA